MNVPLASYFPTVVTALGEVADGVFDGVPLGTLTPAGLLAVMILLIATGRLVPRRTMEDAIHDRNEWRTAHRISEQSRAEQDAMIAELLELARTTDAFIRSVSAAAERPSTVEDRRSTEEG